jgi:putative lipase involved disintegration of autophagic bodies
VQSAAIQEKRQAVYDMRLRYRDHEEPLQNHDLIISEDYIDFPEVLEADVVVALAQVAYDRYVDTMKDGAISDIQQQYKYMKNPS